jgi:hypothetical protein
VGFVASYALRERGAQRARIPHLEDTMLTPATRAVVSRFALAVGTSVTLAAAACAPRSYQTSAAAGPERAATVRFDNEAQTYVDVYLIGEQREWLLGRVEPGARAMLRLPPAALSQTAGFMRLATLTGSGFTVQAARDPRATFTIAQPAASMVAQRWTFSQRQLSTPEILSSRR